MGSKSLSMGSNTVTIPGFWRGDYRSGV